MSIKVGIIGLGKIAQSTYLPLLSTLKEVEIVGAYSPTKAKAKIICEQYQITYIKSLEEIVKTADALFVHSSTASHYEIISYILDQGKPVYVDKPLAETVEQSEELVEKATRKNLQLMVGFNRRYAPTYQLLKNNIKNPRFIHVEKHRMALNNNTTAFTLLDDYIHTVDTLYWLSGENLEITTAFIKENQENQLELVHHAYNTERQVLQTTMDRVAGTMLEKITVIENDRYYEVVDMLYLETRTPEEIKRSQIDLSISALERRGFLNAILEFIHSLKEQRMPLTSGDSVIVAQRLIAQMSK